MPPQVVDVAVDDVSGGVRRQGACGGDSGSGDDWQCAPERRARRRHDDPRPRSRQPDDFKFRDDYESDIAQLQREREQERANGFDRSCRERGASNWLGEHGASNWLADEVPDRRVVFISNLDRDFANRMHRFERFLKYAIAHAVDPSRFPRPPRIIPMLHGSASWMEWAKEYDGQAVAERKTLEGQELWDSIIDYGRDASALEGGVSSVLANDLVPKNRNFCVPKNLATGSFRGMAYVTFRTPELAQQFLRSASGECSRNRVPGRLESRGLVQLRVLTHGEGAAPERLLASTPGALPQGSILHAQAELARSTKRSSVEMASRVSGHQAGRSFNNRKAQTLELGPRSNPDMHQAREEARLENKTGVWRRREPERYDRRL